VAGALALALHLPPSLEVVLAIGAPWATVTVLLGRRGTAERLIGAWREATSTGAGAFGVVGLGLLAWGVGWLATAAAGVLLALWLAGAASLIGVLRGPAVQREQMAGWSLAALALGAALLAAEGVLRLPSVAARLGTPQEVDRWRERYEGSWEENLLGLRSPYETVRKEPGVFRVVAIGDSFTWGDKIASADSTWPARLEDDLRRHMPGLPVEVVNLGQNGFTAVNEAEMLRRLGWQLDPDVVVVQFYLNDILPGRPGFGREYSLWLFPRRSLLPWRYRNPRWATSALADLVEGVLWRLRHGDAVAQVATWTELYRRRGPEWTALAGALAEMGGAAAERGVPIVLMLFPDFIPGIRAGDELPFAAIHEQVADVAKDAGFSVLDLTPAYLREGADLGDWWATPWDAHPNEAAAGVAARTLADHLMATFELPRR
jgi:lysophospholipase L1-like esterase